MHLTSLEGLHSLDNPWPFCKWGIDLVGLFPQATSQHKFQIVAVDYFTKWIEAEPLAKITAQKIEDFSWKSIVCRFGLPVTIVTNNGTQFSNKNFKGFCERLGIRQIFSSVEHPQSNGQAEATNKVIR